MRIERKVGVSRNGKCVNRERVQQLAGFDLCRHRARRSKLGQTIGDVEDEDDEGTVGRAFDLKVSEERVGAEQVDGFVYYVAVGGISYFMSC